MIYNRRHGKKIASETARSVTQLFSRGSRFIPAEEIRAAAPPLIFVKIPAILVHGRKTFPPDQSPRIKPTCFTHTVLNRGTNSIRVIANAANCSQYFQFAPNVYIYIYKEGDKRVDEFLPSSKGGEKLREREDGGLII